jgi:hypothetical protein
MTWGKIQKLSFHYGLSLTKLFQGFSSKPLNDYLQHAGI